LASTNHNVCIRETGEMGSNACTAADSDCRY